MKVTVYTSFDDLPSDVAGIPSGRQRTWLLSMEWYRCLWDTVLSHTAMLRIYVVGSGTGESLAYLCCCTPFNSTRTLSSLTNYYTTNFGPVVHAAHDISEVCGALANFVANERPRWHTIGMDYLRRDDAATAALASALTSTNYSVGWHHQYENWYLPSSKLDSATFLAQRPSRLRNTLQRKGRKLKKEHEVTFTLHREEGSALETAIRDYISVYNSSWKRPEPYSGFLPELVRRSARSGCLRLGILYVDSDPAAAQLWITSAGHACVYKLAYKEDYADTSVGSLLSQEMFGYALDVDCVNEIDYGVGSEAYKHDWTTSVRQIEGLRAYSPRTFAGISGITLTRLRPFKRAFRSIMARHK